MKEGTQIKLALVIGACLLIALLVVGCTTPTPAPTATPVPPTKAPAAAPTAAPAVATAVPAPAKPAVDQAAIQKAWESGPHNNKYDLYHGPNTYCARCHSPGNWDPKATVSTPPNCFSCKFPTDKEVRISAKAPLIQEADWKKVNCSVCHEVKGGVTDGKIAIWNNGTGKYDKVTSNTDLCEKCHVDSLGGSMHKIKLGGGAHSNQIGQAAQRPEECTDCHDPHSMKADCKNCHAAAFPPAKTTIAGHDAAHAKVTCVACHNANPAMTAAKHPTQDLYVSGSMGSSPGGGPPTFSVAYSHIFKKAVVCTTCHFDNNPMKIRSLVTPTAVPTKPSPVPTK